MQQDAQHRDFLHVASNRVASNQQPLAQKEYTYTGYLSPWLPEIVRLLKSGFSPKQIERWLVTKEVFAGSMVGVNIVATIKYIEERMGLRVRASDYSTAIYNRARSEHAWSLRVDGLTLKAIGERLGVSGERARCMFWQFGRRLGTAMRRTRFRISVS